MARINPKWLDFDGDTLTIVDDEGTDKLSISVDPDGGLSVSANGVAVDLEALVAEQGGVVIDELNSEYINDSKIQVRTASDGAPPEEGGRDQSKDFYIVVPG